VVAVAGSRALPASGSALAVRVASDLAASGASFAVGCCSGADAALLSAVPGSVPPSLVRCFAAFGPGGEGAGPFSAALAVQAFAASGGSVSWWAGGPASVPLRSRLAGRTRAVVGAADAGLVAFFGSANSRGSLFACRLALSRGLPVVAFPVGFSAAELPLLGAGSWAPVGAFGGFEWVQNQAEIFY
jgi:predicted Rossmann fold nucleotide-binding protein DprA/Smf involved in DNA uptake